MPEKEVFRRKIGVELTSLKPAFCTMKKAVCLFFSYCPLEFVGPKTPAMLAQHLALVLLPRAGLAPLPMHLLQGKAKYRHGRLEVEENPDRLKSRQRHTGTNHAEKGN